MWQKTEIILTVPHGSCPENSIIRKCDKRANRSAKQLEKILIGDGWNVKLFNNTTILRSIVDMNREESINTDFRKTISEQLISKDKIFFLYDIHSFPASDPDWGTYNLIILDDDPMTFYGSSLFTHCLQKNINAKLVRGSKLNSIQEQARQNNIRALILEFNENLDDSITNEICNEISSWTLLQINHSRKKK